MYKWREAFYIHRLIKETLQTIIFVVRKYPCGNNVFKDDKAVFTRYLNAITKGQTKVRSEFESFLDKKIPNELAKFVESWVN